MIKIIKQPLSREELNEFVGKPYSEMIKFVVDVQKEILGLGGELHADAEDCLLKEGSSQADLWGGNYYPGQKRIEYGSFINIRPSVGNRSMEVENEKIKGRIQAILKKLLP